MVNSFKRAHRQTQYPTVLRPTRTTSANMDGSMSVNCTCNENKLYMQPRNHLFPPKTSQHSAKVLKAATKYAGITKRYANYHVNMHNSPQPFKILGQQEISKQIRSQWLRFEFNTLIKQQETKARRKDGTRVSKAKLGAWARSAKATAILTIPLVSCFYLNQKEAKR